MGWLSELFGVERPKPRTESDDYEQFLKRLSVTTKQMADRVGASIDRSQAMASWAERQLEQYVEEDEAVGASLADYVPPVERKRYETGDFLCYGDHAWPVRHITGIRMASRGMAPWIHDMGTLGPSAGPASDSRISVHLFDGHVDLIKIDRRCATALLEALLVAWRGEPL